MPDETQRTNNITSLADIARHMNIASSDTKTPDVEFICTYCNDLGLITYEVPIGHPHHGKLVPCPRCEKGRETNRIILSRKYKQIQLPQKYSDARLNDWLDNLSSEQRKAKYLAYCFTVTFAENAGVVSTHQAIELLQEANHALNLFKVFPDFLLKQLQQADKVRQGLVLQGSVGIGKTWLMAAALNAMRDKHHVIFVKSSDLFEEITSTWGTYEKESDALDRYRHAEILFLDDVHIEVSNKLSTYQRDIMTKLIRHRYDDKMPTMITTNSDKETFYEEWGKRVADATLDMCHWIPMAGEKLRDTTQDWSAI